jgi:hypothetical protein
MSNVVMALLSVEKGHTATEDRCISAVDESGEENTEMRMKFGVHWDGIDREGQKAVVQAD